MAVKTLSEAVDKLNDQVATKQTMKQLLKHIC